MFSDSNFCVNIPINNIRHDDLLCYVCEGWGGTDIDNWPIYIFYREYLFGNRLEACAKYCRWYMDQLRKYDRTKKKCGGMFKGSLYSLVSARLSSAGLAYVGVSGNEEYDLIVKNAIRERVMQRFMLAENIDKVGYDPSLNDPVVGIRRSDGIYFKNGHHRAAILKALGYTECPGVLVFNEAFTYELWRIRRKVIRWANL